MSRLGERGEHAQQSKSTEWGSAASLFPYSVWTSIIPVCLCSWSFCYSSHHVSIAVGSCHDFIPYSSLLFEILKEGFVMPFSTFSVLSSGCFRFLCCTDVVRFWWVCLFDFWQIPTGCCCNGSIFCRIHRQRSWLFSLTARNVPGTCKDLCTFSAWLLLHVYWDVTVNCVHCF